MNFTDILKPYYLITPDSLKHFNLSKNQIYAVPQLMLVRWVHVPCTSAPTPPPPL